MERTEIKQLPQPMKAMTFYVDEPKHGWWAFITVCPEASLLQVHCHFGTFSARWEGTNGNFLEHLSSWRRGYIKGDLKTWALATFEVRTMKQQDRIGQSLDRLMDWLWPLFLDRLKGEVTTT